MAEDNLKHITSTPLERSSLALNLTGDSGYVSNSSGNISGSFLNHSKISETHLDESSKHLDSISETENAFCEKVKFKSSLHDKRRVPESWQQYHVGSPRLNLCGRKHVDFMYYLGDWYHHSIIVHKILSYLNDDELHNAANVSKTWRQIITSTPSEDKRLRLFLKQKEHSKENQKTDSSDRNRCPMVHCFNTLTPRNKSSPLSQIQNLQESVSSSSASPPNKFNYRFEAYQKEAQRLKNSKQLFRCPKCELPSHVDPKIPNSAQCTNFTCKYRFCIVCKCAEHSYKTCDFISTPIRRKSSDIFGTAKNKRNLKRCLL